VTDPDQGFGEQSNRGIPKSCSLFLNTQGCLRKSLGITQKWLRFKGQEWLFLR